MPNLTLGQAAKATGKQKSTILDAIRTGRLSAGRDPFNRWQIDPAELFRVYPSQPTPERQETQSEPHTTPFQMLEKEREERERERRQLENQLDDLKADRDHWREQAERMTLLLTHKPPAVNTNETPAQLSLWRRLTGKA